MSTDDRYIRARVRIRVPVDSVIGKELSRNQPEDWQDIIQDTLLDVSARRDVVSLIAAHEQQIRDLREEYERHALDMAAQVNEMKATFADLPARMVAAMLVGVQRQADLPASTPVLATSSQPTAAQAQPVAPTGASSTSPASITRPELASAASSVLGAFRRPGKKTE